MKRIAVILTFFLSVIAANAQIGKINTAHSTCTERFVSTEPSSLEFGKSNATMRKIEMTDDERLIGFYTTDDLPDLSSGAYEGFTSNLGQLKVGAVFDNNVIGKYVGGEITKMRFALACETAVANVFICEVSTNYDLGSVVAEVDLSSVQTVSGWNDVVLDTPITIAEDTYYLIGYEYTQVSGGYPVVSDKDLDVDYNSDYGFIVYGDFGYGVDWYFVNGGGNLCVQAVVKGGNIADDIAISALSADIYYSIGSEYNYSFNIKSDGSEIPSSYSLTLELDGAVIETLYDPIHLTTSQQTVSGSINLGDDFESGTRHTFSVAVEKINGNTPEQNIGDDKVETTFMVYSGSVDRQKHVIEQFTSTYCTYCPRGDAVLETLMDDNPDKYACVSIHTIMMGSDPYYVTDGWANYLETYSDLEGYPSATFSRYILDDKELNENGTLAIGIGYSNNTTAARLINESIDRGYEHIPAFVSVDISTDYDVNTRVLTIKVSGNGVDIAKDLLDGNPLTVYLTEDGLIGRQYSSGVWVDEYLHNDVMRLIANEYPWGDEINWTSDSSYENEIVAILENDWDWENMKVVALISGPMVYSAPGGLYWGNKDEAYVNNANQVWLTNGNVTGISSVLTDANAVETARYTTDGRSLSSATKGINIVRMSDGSVRKVVVR